MTDFGKRTMGQKASSNADQVEIDAVRLGSAVIASALDDEFIADETLDYETQDIADDIERRNIVADAATSDVMVEILRRASILGDAYPFHVSNNSLTFRGSQFGKSYQFCLVVSTRTNITSRPYNLMPSAFEQLAAECTKIHFGSFANTLHTGWPRRNGMPSGFKDLADVVHQQTGEWWWRPYEQIEENDANPVKDAGIDFITWVRSPDGLPGQLFVLGQCACGNNWQSKYDDLNRGKYRRWFHPISWLEDQAKAFCVPYMLSAGNIQDVTEQAGLVYDRVRLVLLAEPSEEKLSDGLLEELDSCIEMAFSQTGSTDQV